MPSYSKLHTRRDENEPDIVAALERACIAQYGVHRRCVVRLTQPCDLMVFYGGRTRLLEVKEPKTKNRLSSVDVSYGGQFAGCDRTLTVAQATFVVGWPDKVHIVTTPQEALHAIGAKCEEPDCEACQ